MARKGMMQPGQKGEIIVCVEDMDTGYLGQVTRVFVDKEWLWITTDDPEGSVMLNIEALPYLQEALRQIAKSTEMA